MNVGLSRILVKISARLSSEGTCMGLMSDLFRSILTHSCLQSMCLRRVLFAVLFVNTSAAALSMRSMAGSLKFMLLTKHVNESGVRLVFPFVYSTCQTVDTTSILDH